jgi:hypothetical protein
LRAGPAITRWSRPILHRAERAAARPRPSRAAGPVACPRGNDVTFVLARADGSLVDEVLDKAAA